jgi:predicted PurR-regulated permease PerM
MSLQRQLATLIGALVGVLLIFYFFSPVLMPFVAGLGVAYALDPVADWLEKHGLSRFAATFLILILFVFVLVFALLSLLPVLARQLADLIANIPATVDRLQNLITPLFSTRLAQVLGLNAASLRSSLSGSLNQGVGMLTGMLGSIWVGGRALIDIISLMVVTPVVAFYMLYDWDRMIAKVDSWLPRKQAPTIRLIAGEIGHAVSGFIRGQGLTCLFLGLWYAAGLSLVGLNFGLVIGIGAGLISFIPFIGTLSGFLIGIAVALAQFWPDYVPIGAVAMVFFSGQFLEGYILQPRLVGNRVGLHPVWLIFALLAFGYALGFVGLLIAVPLTASIGVLVRFALRRYLASSYYAGDETEALPPPPERKLLERH